MRSCSGNRAASEADNGPFAKEAMLGSDLIVARVNWPRGKAKLFHTPEGEHIVVVLRGCCRLCLPAGDVMLRAHQMAVVPAGVEYSSEALEETEAIQIRTRMFNEAWTQQGHEQQPDPDQYLWGV